MLLSYKNLPKYTASISITFKINFTMEDLFLVLFLASIVAFIIGLAKPDSFSRVLGNYATRKGTATIFGVAFVVSFILFGITAEPSETVNNSNDSTQTQEEQSDIEIPQYSVLDKTEHISTRMSDDQASYFGDVLVEEDMMGIPPEEFTEIARVIAEREGLDYSASFYSTEEAFRANTSVYVPEENRALIEQAGGIESNQEYMPQAEIDRLLSEGYIGSFEDGEFTMSPSSAYYEQHHGGSSTENETSSGNETGNENNDSTSATQNQPTQTQAQSEPEPEPETPSETVSQKNAVRSAKAYLDYSAFSYNGLIEQLEYEQFSHADAVYGADNSGADWLEQAAKSAEAYMEYSSFSRGGLIEQLKYEGFTQAQAEHGANAVGL